MKSKLINLIRHIKKLVQKLLTKRADASEDNNISPVFWMIKEVGTDNYDGIYEGDNSKKTVKLQREKKRHWDEHRPAYRHVIVSNLPEGKVIPVYGDDLHDTEGHKGRGGFVHRWRY